MGEFNTEETMEEIHRQILANHLHLGDLSFTTFYYRKLVQMLKKPEKLILFGAGRYGEFILSMLMQEDIRTVQCFCDNSVQQVGKSLCGMDVLSPQEAFCKYPDACFVITPKDYENEILRQLVHMGIDIDNIVVFNIKNTGMAVE